MHLGAAVIQEVSNVWELSGDDRRRLITASLKCRYDIAMEELKESMKQYNITRDIYEVTRWDKGTILL